MAHLRIYLDTSVLSALLDSRAPDRLILTEGFFARCPRDSMATSELTRDELAAVGDSTKREMLLNLLDSLDVFQVTNDMQELANEYVTDGVFSELQYNDALHVAAAVSKSFPILASWNFKHLVNRQRRLRIQSVNAKLLLSGIEILSPPEI